MNHPPSCRQPGKDFHSAPTRAGGTISPSLSERPGVIGLDEPFGERLVVHLVESPKHDDDVRERCFTQGGQVSECCQP